VYPKEVLQAAADGHTLHAALAKHGIPSYQPGPKVAANPSMAGPTSKATKRLLHAPGGRGLVDTGSSAADVFEKAPQRFQSKPFAGYNLGQDPTVESAFAHPLRGAGPRVRPAPNPARDPILAHEATAHASIVRSSHQSPEDMAKWSKDLRYATQRTLWQ
jgi:hypothetical protein